MKLINAKDKITCNFKPKLRRFGLALSTTMFVGIGLLFTCIPALSATLTGAFEFDSTLDDSDENIRVDFNLNFNDEGLFLLEGSTVTFEGEQRNVTNAMLDENGNLQSLSTNGQEVDFRTGEITRTVDGEKSLIGTGAMVVVPEPLTILGSTTALGLGVLLKQKSSKKKKS